MMKKLLLLFMAMGLFISCSDDDDNTQVDTLNGSWTMTKYLAFAPQLPPLSDGDVIWVFNTENSTVSIYNQAAPYFSEEGTFDYHLEGNAIFIHKDDYQLKYFYSFDNGSLKLESELSTSDGPIMHFKKYTYID